MLARMSLHGGHTLARMSLHHGHTFACLRWHDGLKLASWQSHDSGEGYSISSIHDKGSYLEPSSLECNWNVWVRVGFEFCALRFATGSGLLWEYLASVFDDSLSEGVSLQAPRTKQTFAFRAKDSNPVSILELHSMKSLPRVNQRPAATFEPLATILPSLRPCPRFACSRKKWMISSSSQSSRVTLNADN